MHNARAITLIVIITAKLFEHGERWYCNVETVENNGSETRAGTRLEGTSRYSHLLFQSVIRNYWQRVLYA